MVGMRWKFQSIGEYNAILGLYNIKCEQTDGRVNGREYHGLVYFATDDNGNVIVTPLKASRLGKFASRTAIDSRFERAKDKIDIAPTRRSVADALARSSDKDGFIAKLKESNIDVVFRYTDEGRIYGVTFVDHGTQTSLNGSRLGKEFSANALQTRFSQAQPQQPIQQQPNRQPTSVPTVVPPPSSPSNTTSGTANTTNTAQPRSAKNLANDYDPIIPGLDLFQPGQSVNPDEEDFRRRLQRKKKGMRRRF